MTASAERALSVVAGAESAPRQRGPKGLTLRDRHLLGVLATARYLSTEQVWRLFYPGRLIRTAGQSLEALAGHGRYGVRRPLVRGVAFRAVNGAPLVAWTLTPDGYELAEETLGRLVRVPDQDIGLDFMEHTLQLNELLVDLLVPPPPKRHYPKGGRTAAQAFARADFRAFRWTSSEGARLPWREYDAKAGRSRTRVVLPDAVLELVGISGRGADSASPPRPRDLAPAGADPALRFERAREAEPRLVPNQCTGRRLFLECEMGTQTIVAPAGDKPGSTVAKVERYHQYVRRYADPASRVTFYQAQYPDGFAPEVLFLVRSPVRAAHVNEALAAWRKTARDAPRDEPIAARGLTFADASRELRSALGLAPVLPGRVTPASAGVDEAGPLVPQRDAEVFARFVTEAMRELQGARRQVRALPEAVRSEHRLSEPNYPKDAQAAQELAARLVPTPKEETKR